jgi:O-antigen ligase
MGSTVAIVVFFSFILVGFVIEARGRKKITHAVWLPLFWMVICASRSINQWLNLSGSNIRSKADYIQANLEGSPIDRVVLSIAIVCGIIIIYRRKEAVIGIFKNNKALLAFTVYLGITVLWSDIGEVSFRRWIRLVGNFVMAAVLMTEPEPFESVRSIFRRTAYLLIPLSVMFVKYFPQMGVLYTRLGATMWIGVALMKNGLGHLCFVFSFFLIWDAITTWRKKGQMKFSRALFDIIILMMCLWLFRGPGGAYSSASIGCLVLGMAMLIGLRVPVNKRNLGGIGVLIILAVALFLVFEYSFGIIKLIVTGLGKDMTFTDRVPLWNTLVDIGLRKPFLGYGYGGFWFGERLDIIEDFSIGHNGYLEIFVEGGLVAIILLIVLLISVLRTIQRSGLSDYEQAVFRLCFLAMILLANVTESSFAREQELLTFVFYIIALNIVTPRKMFQRYHQIRP